MPYQLLSFPWGEVTSAENYLDRVILRQISLENMAQTIKNCKDKNKHNEFP